MYLTKKMLLFFGIIWLVLPVKFYETSGCVVPPMIPYSFDKQSSLPNPVCITMKEFAVEMKRWQYPKAYKFLAGYGCTDGSMLVVYTITDKPEFNHLQRTIVFLYDERHKVKYVTASSFHFSGRMQQKNYRRVTENLMQLVSETQMQDYVFNDSSQIGMFIAMRNLGATYSGCAKLREV